ncbi:MAG: hypothetical protein K6G22_05085 [Lachnospiraceae bacterium]|nr:hypothetical protein [Lachnospiraceae bacterium]
MEYDVNLLDSLGIDTEAGIGYTGGQDKYVAALQRFYKSYDKNRAKVEEYYNNLDIESYMITVHALKSNAKMIGAMQLSRQFEMLETAARENDRKTIDENTMKTLVEYKALVDRLKPIASMGDVHAADEISAEEAVKTADELLEALDDFDDETSKKLVKKLSGYPFRLTQRDLLAKAAGYIDDFMYDEAADIIKEICTQIE